MAAPPQAASMRGHDDGDLGCPSDDGSSRRSDRLTAKKWRARAWALGRVIAETDKPQVVNQRIYFPLEDCFQQHMLLSTKRWR
ncbi:hypothetical protein GUITHDRAFT_154901 [Guillardia theta CCMP2712]|uniref:Uncharacterized protein n=1 Tax=Guillardia theta (strain CCMP2712) TaxID=905079 RepID=L1IN31_GUITC|nr:hypothetical protein GUITHDRAFT_154901 [Guillardia theta CCMP2712]EKX37673.1 hypothetical protein GUITHDRAFT_154901 [Guillardia theta CCMP2712]|eukprot:XP_005824653.1 hypothetical protein GUITHDRAFT_154901 [Guillardia theta CCMP2712]